MKNWKSTLSFFIFIGIYIFSVMSVKSDSIVNTAGYIALYSSIFMMLRNELTAELIKTIIDKINFGDKK